MKVSQLVEGGRYESKDGKEVREITSLHSDGTLRYTIVPIVADTTEARTAARIASITRRRDHESTKKEFAEWAARKAGTSTHRSTTGNKFLTTIQGRKG